MDGDSAISPTRGHRDLPPDVEEAGAGAHPLTAPVLAAVSDTDLGEACAISDVASRLGGAIMIALVPVLIGVEAGGGLSEALVHGYLPAMIILAGLCLVAAVISAVFVHDSRVAGPRFSAPAPYHGCALPDMGTAEHPLSTTARTSETS